MCFEKNRLELIENLTQSFKPVITVKNMPELYKDNFFKKPVLNGDDIALYFDATAMFKPFDGANFAKISFNLIFEDCALNPDTGLYEWDKESFKVEYDFEYNLMFCRVDETEECEKPDWVLQTFEQNFSDDEKIGCNVLNAIFSEMDEDEFKSFANAAYKAACDGNTGMMPSVDLVSAV